MGTEPVRENAQHHSATTSTWNVEWLVANSRVPGPVALLLPASMAISVAYKAISVRVSLEKSYITGQNANAVRQTLCKVVLQLRFQGLQGSPICTPGNLACYYQAGASFVIGRRERSCLD